MERLAREKIATQQHLAELKNDLSQWMEVMEIERLLRQTVQPEEDQASTSTASGGGQSCDWLNTSIIQLAEKTMQINADSAAVAEGEDMEEDLEEEPAARPKTALPTVPQPVQPERQPAAPAPAPNPPPASATSIVTQHVSITPKAPPRQPHLHPAPHIQPAPKAAAAPTLPATPIIPAQPPMPTPTQVATMPGIHPTVIAHASVSHPSVIQAVNHVIQGGAPKRIAPLAPSPTTTSTTAVQLPAAHQSIGHITVHPVAHLSQHLPALYPQPVAVPQPAVVGHIAHTLNHSLTHAHPQMNGATPVQQAAAIIGKQTAMSAQMVAHHPQLMGPAVLNPVTMVTMPSFPISTLKLA